MTNDFSHARAAAAAPTKTTSSAQQRHLRSLGNADEVSSTSTPTPAATHAIDPLIAAAVSHSDITYRHASASAPTAEEAAASGATGVNAGACVWMLLIGDKAAVVSGLMA